MNIYFSAAASPLVGSGKKIKRESITAEGKKKKERGKIICYS